MDRSTKRLSATLLATTVGLLLIGGVSVLAFSGTVAADQHEPENAPTYATSDGGVNFTIGLPHTTDHYPGNHPVHSEQNGYNASIEYYATAQAALTEQDAEEGAWLDFIEVSADWIDYSECDATQNTKVFGIDRGNNNSGTQTDEDLIEHRRSSTLYAGGLIVQFFDWSDLSGDPPYVSPQDAVVAAQGAGSDDGPCLKMTSETGWYRVDAYTNGTIANQCTEEGNPDCEPDPKEWRGLKLKSNYIYICECDSKDEARNELGRPPDEQDGEATPTPTPEQPDDTPTPTEAQPEDTPTPTEAQPDDTPTPTQATTSGGGGGGGGGEGGGGGGGAQTATQADGGGGGGGGDAARGTPTISNGPGFTPLVALAALLGAALLVLRRR
jgi:PGF-CTERM protein